MKKKENLSRNRSHRFELAAARSCAMRNGETSVRAMLKSFVENELRNQAFDYDRILANRAREERKEARR